TGIRLAGSISRDGGGGAWIGFVCAWAALETSTPAAITTAPAVVEKTFFMISPVNVRLRHRMRRTPLRGGPQGYVTRVSKAKIGRWPPARGNAGVAKRSGHWLAQRKQTP